MISDHGTNHDPHAATAVDRRALVAELMSASSDSVEAEPASTVILLGRLCRAVAEYMSAAGVAVSLVSDAGSAGVVASSSELSRVGMRPTPECRWRIHRPRSEIRSVG